jgi:hypothetical protein
MLGRSFAYFVTFSRLWMASHDIDWPPGVHVCFGSLDFIITMEGKLVQAIAPVQSPLPTGLNAIVEALEELQLNALKARALERD